MPTEQQLRWAEVFAIEKVHGSNTPRWIAERIGALAVAGDEPGVARFKQIASRFDQLMRGERQ